VQGAVPEPATWATMLMADGPWFCRLSAREGEMHYGSCEA
jgi:hypothetical protein